jgi:Putative peptidoglycan binding domain/Domain of unknown function (DUF4189)
MIARLVTLLVATIAATGAVIGTSHAQGNNTARAIAVGPAPGGDNTVRINGALEGDKLPFLCRDRESVGLIIPIVSRAQEARVRGENTKAEGLMEVAARLQSEICQRPAADDVVILRCKLDQTEGSGGSVSTVKVGAILRSDPVKVEQPFYAWTNAVVDESGAPGTCTGEAGGDAFQASADILLRVQQRLYDFGLRMADLNGQMSPETVQALSQFQKWAKLPETGQLSKQTMEKLFLTPAVSPWVTFAFDGYGNYAAATGGTRRNAELGAIEQLQRRSRADFKVSSVAAPNCLGFAVTRYSERYRRSRTNFTQAFTSVGDSVDAAIKNAIDYCERDKGGGECNIRYALCATGEDISDSQQAREDPERRDGRDGSDDRGRREGRDRRDRRDNRDGRDGREGRDGQQEGRFDPKKLPVNTQGPRFDQGSLPINSQGPSDAPSSRFNRDSGPPLNSRAPTDDSNNPGGPIRRFDPKNIPANSQAPR